MKADWINKDSLETIETTNDIKFDKNNTINVNNNQHRVIDSQELIYYKVLELEKTVKEITEKLDKLYGEE